MQSNREAGDNFDRWVQETLSPYLFRLQRTVNSGATFGDQDLVSDELRISCKLRQGRSLSRAELLEPYIAEPVNSIRAPVTIFRWLEETECNDYAFVDLGIMRQWGKNLTGLIIEQVFADWEILETWSHGVNRTLTRILGPPDDERVVIIIDFHEQRGALFCHLPQFVDFIIQLEEYARDAGTH